MDINGLATAKLQTLRFAENLTLPKVQVVVMRANVGCSHCRSRVSQVVAKMNAGLLDYMVDLRKEEVVIRGLVDLKRKRSYQKLGKESSKKPSAFLSFFRLFWCSRGM